MMSNNILNNDQPFSLQVATPSHRGLLCSTYVSSVSQLQTLCMMNGIDFELRIWPGNTNIDHVRNLMVQDFLDSSNATHILFIDDDMGFNPSDLMEMLACAPQADVIGALYPQKQFDWHAVKNAILANPNIEVSHIPHIAASFAHMAHLSGSEDAEVGRTLIRMALIPAGMMLISRSLLLRLIESGVPSRVKNLVRMPSRKPTSHYWEFFKTIAEGDRFISEDYSFCQMVNDNGGTVMGCPWVVTTHTGSYSYIGDLPAKTHYVP